MNTEMISPWSALAVCWGWSLVHSLWMLALIALAVVCVLKVMARAAASSRYAVMIAALALMAAAPFFALRWTAPEWPASSVRLTDAAVNTSDAAGDAVANLSGTDSAKECPTCPRIKATSSETGAGRQQIHSVPQPIGDLAARLAALLDPVLPWVAALWFAGVLLASLRLTCGGV